MSRARPARPPGGAEAPRLQAWRPPGVAPPRAPVATPEPADPGSVYDRIYAWVTRIPPGKVATYGQIAALVGRCTPRMVGYALAALPAERAEVPWQRVVNAAGAVSERGAGGGTDHQQARLRAEGVLLDRRGRIDLERFRWQGPEEPVLGPDPGEGPTDSAAPRRPAREPRLTPTPEDSAMIARIRTVTGADLAAVHALNEGALPHVNRVDESVLDWFRAEATRFVVAEVDGEIRAFMVALAPPTAYWSDNYNWFVERHTGFVYVDRVAVHPDWHGRGLGRALYDDLLAAARRAGDIRAVACEVNLRPPNPGSLAFHRRLGFREVGELDHDGGAKRVAMLMRTV